MSPGDFPWTFPYRPDPTLPETGGRAILRPVLDVTFDGLDVWTPALVDSGSRFNLAANWIARGLGIVLDDDDLCHRIRIAGATRVVSFHEVSMGIRPHLSSGDPHQRWSAKVGFIKSSWEPPWMILGQVGFFDHFTITMQAEVGAMAIEEPKKFRQRFPNATALPE